MTYQGAIDELKSLENNESMPDWFKPSLKKVRETMEMDRRETLDDVRSEILVLDDPDYDYDGYYKAVTDALHIIDKYKAESEDRE